MKYFFENWFYNRSAFKAYRVKGNIKKVKVIDVFGPPGIGKTTFLMALQKAGVIEKKRVFIDFKEQDSSPHALLLSAAALKHVNLLTLKRKANKLHFDINIQNGNSCYLVDEGISHQFTTQLLGLYTENRHAFDDFCSTRAAINLSAPVSLINERINLRHNKSGVLNKHHKGKSTLQLEEFQKKLLEKRKLLCEAYESAGMPVLTIDTSYCSDDLIIKTKFFLKNLE